MHIYLCTSWLKIFYFKQYYNLPKYILILGVIITSIKSIEILDKRQSSVFFMVNIFSHEIIFVRMESVGY